MQSSSSRVLARLTTRAAGAIIKRSPKSIRRLATVTDPAPKVRLDPWDTGVEAMLTKARTQPSSIKSLLYRMASVWPPKLFLDLSQAWVYILMPDRAMKVKI